MSDLLKKDLKYIWHPYTQMKDTKELPPDIIDRAEDMKIFNMDGSFYYDTIASWWCNIHGHNHSKIINRIRKQAKILDQIPLAGFSHKPAIQLAEKLIKLMPKHITKVFYSDNGSTSVEVALKMSLQYWANKGIEGKNKFISLDLGYHGDTIGTMSVSGDIFNQSFKPLLFKSYKAKSPYCYRCPCKKNRETCKIECIKYIENILKKNSEKVSAIILEPMVLCAGGMIIYPKEYLEKVYKLAKKYKVHLIVDEVATGFGRTGKMFAFEHADNIKPDFICVSKGITSGTLPLAATLTTDDVYEAFYDDYSKKKTFFHGHTYTANPIACAAAIATLEVFDDENTLFNVQKNEKILKICLSCLEPLKHVGDIRSLGMIGAIELVKNKKTKKKFHPDERIGYKIYREALERNLILRPLGDTIYTIFPLSVTEKDLRFIYESIYHIIENWKEVI
jgi:adenosylmethionine-8-amino-7-oxononanoate aminotransferase